MRSVTGAKPLQVHDDFSALPGRVYIYGFTRAFARAVGLDEESVVAALQQKMQLAEID